ncbi:hypothetical protein GM51_21920 [freshwater metagenome]|uniref:Enoyl-CoA hydratase n=1 Tax=freshwater metagenome TaxID=449393 RepID=A0A094PLU0_9ZZZZ|nr:DUF3000 domain-containing protein [Actinomycetota bacterium]MDA3026016.1 DUF3000 domain-containing protein [Actinomycetota bacterium]MDP4668466.1 DUF3000 domain-containing protein [Candidatus Nanopelagicales bacterium]MDP4985953.1 DUF3000 domain-containing protein [Candidatus Nanopelagicales bacterium]
MKFENPQFEQLVTSLRSAPFRPEITTEEVPAPMRLAPYSLAIAAEVLEGENDLSNGRLVLLFDPQAVPAWNGTTRLVTFTKARVEADLASDPLLTQVGWTWLLDCFSQRGIKAAELSGTVTRTSSDSYGELNSHALEGTIEIRASWTVPDQIELHVAAWGDLLCQAAGLQPLPPGITRIKKTH